ncbi:Gustatory receptor 87b [Halyomorpha halys]|nr:Gustatory receptor 87b [Halyomorpha halys]
MNRPFSPVTEVRKKYQKRMANLMKRSLGKSLQKIFLLSQIVGLVPLKLGPDGFSLSPLLIISSLTFAAFVIVWTSLNAMRAAFFISIPFIQFIAKIVRFILVSYLVSCIVTSLKNLGKMNHVVDDLWCIDIFLSQFGKVVEDAVSTSFSSVCIFLQVVVFAFQMSISGQLHLDIGNIYLFFIITHASECQYTGVLELFLIRFGALIECLKKLRSKNNYVNNFVILSNAHQLLSESLCQVSKIYSVQLFFFTALSLVRFILFFFAIIFLRSASQRDIRILIFLVFPFWLVLATLKFLRVVRMIVIVTSKPKLCLHIAMKKEIVFTACGFFRLDYTLVHSMIAATTTYLVILIQFGQTGLAAPMVAPHPPGLIGNLNTTLFPSMAP